MSITKRSHLLAAIAAVCLSFAAGAARAEDGVLRVGIITDMSGQYSDGNGPGSVIAAQMAAEEIGGTVAGRKIEIISADHQNKPDVATRASRAPGIDRDGVDAIARRAVTSVGRASDPVRSRARSNKLSSSMSGAGSIRPHRSSSARRTRVHWTYDTYALALRGPAKRHDQARRRQPWFFMTADYAFGHSLQNDDGKAVSSRRTAARSLGSVRTSLPGHRRLLVLPAAGPVLRRQDPCARQCRLRLPQCGVAGRRVQHPRQHATRRAAGDAHRRAGARPRACA